MPKISPPPTRLPRMIEEDRELFAYFKQLQISVYTMFAEMQYKNPSQEQSITASGGIVPTNRIMRVVGSGGAITVTATPSIAAPDIDGREIMIVGGDDVNTVTLQDESSLANSDLILVGGANFALGDGDTLHLIYDEIQGKWFEVSRSNN